MQATYKRAEAQQQARLPTSPAIQPITKRPLFAVFTGTVHKANTTAESLLTKEEQAICDMATD